MNSSKEEIQNALKELGGKPMFINSDVFLLSGATIETQKIENLKQLIQYAFVAGQDSKIREVKQVLNIVDPRI